MSTPDTSPSPQTSPQKNTAAVAGKGMPVRPALQDRAPDAHRRNQHDVSVEASLQLPSERDQSTDMTDQVPDAAIEQAHKDVQHGLQDTSKGLETNQAYQKLK